MEYRKLGKTGIRVSAVAFGAGPASGWMDELGPDEQCATIRRALDIGINWFDTAAGYGNGLSELSLGQAFARLGLPEGAHIAAKVRQAWESRTSVDWEGGTLCVVSPDRIRTTSDTSGASSMKIDMKPAAVTLRLKQVSQLRQICLALAQSTGAREILRRRGGNETVRRTSRAFGR